MSHCLTKDVITSYHIPRVHELFKLQRTGEVALVEVQEHACINLRYHLKAHILKFEL